MTKVRTRFAPSPTGFLHIGSLRIILFAYLHAKQNNGDFVLRIEDTDQSRKVEGAEKALHDIVKWLEIDFDEGPIQGGDYGPYTQSERRDIYDKHRDILIEKGEAYPCFCTAERLTEMREEQQAKKLAPRYDRKCRDLSPEEVEHKLSSGEKYVIRQKMPLEGDVLCPDLLRGDIKFQCKELDDQVLIKTDGMPTYQFAVVVDDHLMEISHVIRGEEWIPSFPKNVLLYKAFGWEMPTFVHMPLTLNKGGGKLSKRQGDVTVEDYKNKGYLVETLINFSALLGWHPKDDTEIFDMDYLIKNFELSQMGISPAVFDIEKLDYLNGHYIREMDLAKLLILIKPYLEDNLALTNSDYKKSDDFIKKVIQLEQERIKKLSDITEITEFFFRDKLDYSADLLVWKKSSPKQTKANLEKILELISTIAEEEWNIEKINETVFGYIKSNELKVGDFLWPMRASLTGVKASPSPFEVAEVLRKEESIERIKRGIEKL